MKFISIFVLLALSACGLNGVHSTPHVTSASAHEIYLVRHAEKQAGTDPSLTADGIIRAETLAEILADTGITHIHSTNYKRTRETAAPIAARTGLDVAIYDPSDLQAFAEKLKATVGIHLVVGHSNTTPQLAEALGSDPGTPIFEPTEYDRLYVITLGAETVASRIDRYGVRYQRGPTG